MAGLGAYALTLSDWAKRIDPEGKVMKIVELLSQTNEILMDMKFMEGNLPTGHRCTVRTGLPAVAWRLLNQGVQPTKSHTAQVDEATGILEAWSEVDVEVANLGGNPAAVRMSEAMAFVESMNQEMAQTIFYGNSSTAPEEFNGLAVRYSSLSANNAQNIVSGGGSGSDNSSIWLCVWGDQSLYGIFPKGSQAGLKHQDLGEETCEATAGAPGASATRLRVYRDMWQWKPGLVLKDWRYAVRIPNIDISNLIAKSSAADIIELMIKAIHRVPNIRLGSPAFYMNRTCAQMLDIYRRDDVMAGGGLTFDSVDGRLVYSFRGIPIRICDALLETEAAVT